MRRDGEEPKDQSDLVQRVFPDQLVVEHLPDAVTVHDRHQTIVYFSGREPGYYGKRGSSFVAPEHRDHFDEVFERAWVRGEPQDVEYATAPGRFWLTRLVPIQRDGVVEYMLAATHETTDRVRERNALRELTTRQQQAIDVVGMGTWTHDWQTDAVEWDDAMRAILGLAADVPASRERAVFPTACGSAVCWISGPTLSSELVRQDANGSRMTLATGLSQVHALAFADGNLFLTMGAASLGLTRIPAEGGVSTLVTDTPAINLAWDDECLY